MNSHDAYIATKRALTENLAIDVIDENYDPETFGNFWISFRYSNMDGSIVSDRGQMFICDELRGEGKCKMLFNQLHPVGEQELASILVALIGSGRW